MKWLKDNGWAISWAVILAVFAALVGTGIYTDIQKVKGYDRVNVHMDAPNNVICYAYRDSIDCLPYHDEGTHLEVLPE